MGKNRKEKNRIKRDKIKYYGHKITLYNKKITVPYLLSQEKCLVIINENNNDRLVKLFNKSLREDVNCIVFIFYIYYKFSQVKRVN